MSLLLRLANAVPVEAGPAAAGLSTSGAAVKAAPAGAVTAAVGSTAGVTARTAAPVAVTAGGATTTGVGVAGPGAPTLPTAPLLFTAVTAILACVDDALALTPAGRTARVCVVPGALAWDECDCGLLAVTVDRIYPTRTFPNDAGGDPYTDDCPLPGMAADLTVTVLRCAPNPDQRGNPPTCDRLAAAAVLWRADATTVRTALACCLPGLVVSGVIDEYALRDLTQVGPAGGCVGLEQHLTIGVCSTGCVEGTG